MKSVFALIVGFALCSMLGACGGSGKRASAGAGAGGASAQTAHAASGQAAGGASAYAAGSVSPAQATANAESAARVIAPSGDFRFVARLAQSDGDADNPKDTDGNPDPDYHIDFDSDSFTRASYSYPDGDEQWNLGYGKAAGPAQARLLAGLLARYYAAVRVGDASTACAMLLPSVASKITPSLDERSERRPGETCEEALYAIIRHIAYEFSGAIEVTHVRVDGGRALIAYGSKTMLASFMFLRRYGRTWKLEEPIPAPLP